MADASLHPAPPPRRAPVWFALSFLVVLVWLAPAALRPLTKTDEGRYAEIPREMLHTGNWLTPRLDGFLYFEKPPLQYWGTAAAYVVFGQSEFSARLWTALTGLLGVLLAGWLARRLFSPEVGLAAALVLASSLWWMAMGRVNTLDMGVTFFLTLTVAAFCIAQQRRADPAANRNYMLLSYGAMALAVLSKGLMGLALPGAALVIYSLLQRDRAVWRHLHLGKGLLLFLAIAAPWHVAMTLTHASFARFYFYHEHIERFLTTEHNRYQPPWWFVPVLVGGMLPWVLFAVRPALTGWKRSRAKGTFDARRMLWVWTAFVFLFFSASDSKMIGYIGPCFPTLAILAALEVVRAGPRMLKATAGIGIAFGLGALAVSPFVPRFGVPEANPEMLTGAIPYVVLTGLVFLAGSLYAWRAAGLGRRRRTVVAIAATWFLAISVLLTASLPIEPSQSSRSLAAKARPWLAKGMTVYSVDRYDQSLPFYLDHTMVLVKRRGELEFGIGQEPEKWVATFEEFRKRWRREKRAMAIVDVDFFEREKARGLPMREIARDNRRVVVVRP